MTGLPPPLTGDHGLVTWLNKLRQGLLERTPLQSTACPVDYLPSGFRVHPAILAALVGGEVGQFRVEAIYKNHLLCKPVTLSQTGARTVENDSEILVPSTDTALVRIAKPDELRVIGWDSNERTIAGMEAVIDGVQYDYFANDVHPDEVQNPWNKRTRTISDQEYLDSLGTDSLVYTDEVIYPPYIERHSVIYAAKVNSGTIFSVTEQIIGGVPPNDQATYAVKWVDLNAAGRQFVPRESKIRVCNGTQTGTWYAMIRASDAFQES